MTNKNKLNENASAGSVGAASIAANPSRFGDMQRRDVRASDHSWANSIRQEKESEPERAEEEKKYSDMREKIRLAKEKKKKSRFKRFLARMGMRESFDMSDVVSRLKGIDIDRSSSNNKDNVVSYGIEDDNGNIMKVTVRADQAKEFEHKIARMLSERKENALNGTGNKEPSLAELLFDLRNEFEIIDVQFPIIPTDIVYNANKATKIPDDNTYPEDINNIGNTELNGEDLNQGDLDQEFSEETPNSENGDISNQNGMDSSSPETTGNPEDQNFTDDQSVQNFEEPSESGEESLIKSVLAMMTADAEARKAEADAAAEKSRAKQAEYTAMAADKELQNQEKMARMEAEIEEQKRKEKDAKKMADLAKYRVMQSRGTSASSFGESFLTQVKEQLLAEFDDTQSVQSLNREKTLISQKYKILPTDDQETRMYKQQQASAAMKELNAKIQQAINLTRYKNAQAQKQKQQQNQQNRQQTQVPPPQNQQNQSNQQQNNQQQNNQQTQVSQNQQNQAQ